LRDSLWLLFWSLEVSSTLERLRLYTFGIIFDKLVIFFEWLKIVLCHSVIFLTYLRTNDQSYTLVIWVSYPDFKLVRNKYFSFLFCVLSDVAWTRYSHATDQMSKSQSWLLVKKKIVRHFEWTHLNAILNPEVHARGHLSFHNRSKCLALEMLCKCWKIRWFW